MSCQLAPLARVSATAKGRSRSGWDEAGEEMDERGVVTDPEAPSFGEGDDGVVDDVEGVVAGARLDDAGVVHGVFSSSSPARVELVFFLALDSRSR